MKNLLWSPTLLCVNIVAICLLALSIGQAQTPLVICMLDPVSLKPLPACTAKSDAPCITAAGGLQVSSGQQVQFGLILNGVCSPTVAAPTNLNINVVKLALPRQIHEGSMHRPVRTQVAARSVPPEQKTP